MKKIITAAAFLAASAALASASVVTTVTFSSSLASTSGTGTAWTSAKDNITNTLSTTELFSSFSWGDLSYPSTNTDTPMVLTQNQLPLQNYGCVITYGTSGSPQEYTIGFSLTAGDTDVSISSLTLGMVCAFNGGSIQNAANSAPAMTLALSSGNVSATATQTIYGIGADALDAANKTVTLPESNYVTLTLDSPISVAAGESVSFSINAKAGVSGVNTGFSSIAISATAIPEPSAFGLLAGVGALALVAARRRRSRKA